MRVSFRVVAAAAAFVLATGVAAVGDVEAGDGPPPTTIQVRFSVGVAGSQVPNAATYVPIAAPAGSGGQVGDCTTSVAIDAPFVVSTDYFCDLIIGDTYTISVPTPPAPFTTLTQCGAPVFTDTDQLDLTGEPESAQCNISVVAPTVFVEKDVLGDEPGPLAPDEFTLTVHPGAGGAAVGSGADPDEEYCGSPLDAGVLCGFIELPSGDYALGEEPEYGYFPGFAECRAEPFGDAEPPPIIIDPGDLNPLPPERIDDESGEPIAPFTLGAGEEGFVFCVVLNFYVEGEINIDTTVTNTHGGTATPDDWTVELFDDTNTLVTEVACNVDGTCLSGMFPIGQYAIGQRGPDGYTSTLTITIEDTPPSEALDDDAATFDLPPLGIVNATIASEDQPTTTTSTTVVASSTTTTATTTTVAPVTTAGPTTTEFDGGSVTLPPTGSDNGTGSFALIAALFVVLGGGALFATRRR